MSGRPCRRTGLAGVLALGLGFATAAFANATAATAVCGVADENCRVPLTPARERELALVQTAVNAAIRPASDQAAFGTVEYWTPVEAGGRGDCDDYAVTKLHWLRRLGWPRAALRLTLATLPDGEDHLVLAVRTDRGDYILDNLQPAPAPWTALPYRWLGQEVPGQRAWRAVLPSAATVAAARRP